MNICKHLGCVAPLHFVDSDFTKSTAMRFGNNDDTIWTCAHRNKRSVFWWLFVGDGAYGFCCRVDFLRKKHWTAKKQSKSQCPSEPTSWSNPLKLKWRMEIWNCFCFGRSATHRWTKTLHGEGKKIPTITLRIQWIHESEYNAEAVHAKNAKPNLFCKSGALFWSLESAHVRLSTCWRVLTT